MRVKAPNRSRVRSTALLVVWGLLGALLTVLAYSCVRWRRWHREVREIAEWSAGLVEADPDGFDGWLTFGWSQFYLGRYDEACRAGVRAHKLLPTDLFAAVMHASAAEAAAATRNSAVEAAPTQATAALEHLDDALAPAADNPCSAMRVWALELGVGLCLRLGEAERARELVAASRQCTETILTSGPREEAKLLKGYREHLARVRAGRHEPPFLRVF